MSQFDKNGYIGFAFKFFICTVVVANWIDGEKTVISFSNRQGSTRYNYISFTQYKLCSENINQNVGVTNYETCIVDSCTMGYTSASKLHVSKNIKPSQDCFFLFKLSNQTYVLPNSVYYLSRRCI